MVDRAGHPHWQRQQCYKASLVETECYSVNTMFLLKRIRGLRMLGFGYGGAGAGGEGESMEDLDNENQQVSPQSSPPWLKKQKVSEGNQESKHTNLVQSIRYFLV